jgi:hypothetical protein
MKDRKDFTGSKKIGRIHTAAKPFRTTQYFTGDKK